MTDVPLFIVSCAILMLQTHWAEIVAFLIFRLQVLIFPSRTRIYSRHEMSRVLQVFRILSILPNFRNCNAYTFSVLIKRSLIIVAQ